jgi:hypothetical protein
MKDAISYLDAKCESELKKHALYLYLTAASAADPRRKLDAFIPILGFALTFPYYNKQFLTYPHLNNFTEPAKTLAERINLHAKEDATHVSMLLCDIKKLNLCQVWGLNAPSDLLWTIWSAPSLDETRKILQQRVSNIVCKEHDDPYLRFLHIEQLERDGHYLFSAFCAAVKNQQCIYFGNHHLERESGHVETVEADAINLSASQKIKAIHIINTQHLLSMQMNDLMLSFSYANKDEKDAGKSLRQEKNIYIDRVSAKIKAYQQGRVPPLNWSISPQPTQSDPDLYQQWLYFYEKFKQHPLSQLLKNTSAKNCEKVLQFTMLFFANRMLSLRAFNLFDLDIHKNIDDFSRVRRMFATHAALFFHDWEALNMDKALKITSHDFLHFLFLDKKNVPEITALHEFKREANRTATCKASKFWCYLSINFMAAAFTQATASLAATYAKTYPDRSPLVYMQGILHLLYDEVDADWNNPDITKLLHPTPISLQKKQDIIGMMQRFFEHGIHQWNLLAELLSNNKNYEDYFYTQNDFLQSNEFLPISVLNMLHDEQVLHAKDLCYPWPEDKSVFSGSINPYFYPENQPKFSLPYYLMPEQSILYTESRFIPSSLKNELYQYIDGIKYYKLFVHPEALAYYNFLYESGFKLVTQQESEYIATPTSSYRSLLVWKPSVNISPIFIAKLSLDQVVFENKRLINKTDILRCLATQRLYDDIGQHVLSRDGLTVFPEVAGIIPKPEALKSIPHELGGQLIRQIPDEVLAGQKRWLFFQTLISPHFGPKPLLAELLRRAKLSSKDFVQNYLIDNYLAMLEKITFQKGLIFMPHLQNLALETDANLNLTGQFIIRDYSEMSQDIYFLLNSNINLKSFFNLNSATANFSQHRGSYLFEYGYSYKQLVFNLTIQTLLNIDPQFTQHEAGVLSDILDQKFIALVEKYTSIKLDKKIFTPTSPFPALSHELKNLNYYLAKSAAKKIVVGKKISLSTRITKQISCYIEKGYWHDLIGLFADVKIDKYYITAFLEQHDFYSVNDVIFARSKDGQLVGLLINL